mmetsp:Transcript_9621/g.15895  ORF Transcript_9621/g.15895 Transcript_9621/m.15895 type:complete len:422 (+) Transcript_9621:50-1315(+)
MSRNNKYQRLDHEDDALASAEVTEASTEMTSVGQSSAPELNPLNNQSTTNEGTAGVGRVVNEDGAIGQNLLLKVLFKEKAHEIHGMKPQSTIAEFKAAIETVLAVPPHLQRLIFSGKPMKPDTKTLSDFKITGGSATIHLFPLPVPPTSSVTAAATPVAMPVSGGAGSGGAGSGGISGAVYNPLSVTATPAGDGVEGVPIHSTHGGGGVMGSGTSSDHMILHRPIHFDPQVNQTSREVKLWCLILMFLSGMTLFNNLSYMTSTGKLGDGALDGAVTAIDTMCSAMGLVVGNMGLQSVRTMEIGHVNKYVHNLMMLAVASITLRILWVADVILQVQHAVDSAEDSDSSSGGGDGDSSSKSDNNDNSNNDQPVGPPLDEKMVVTFGIQAVIIAMICICAWASCVLRARRLQSAVRNFNNTMQV